MSKKFENLTDEELRQLLMETIRRMSDKGRVELLKFAKKESPESGGHNGVTA